MKQAIPIFLLVCLLLTGCGGPSTTPKAQTTPPQQTDASEAVAPEPAVLPDPEAYVPSGTWVDDAHPEVTMVIDEKCAGSISVTAEDGTTTVWTFSGVYDSATGGISYTDCVKQSHAPDGAETTVYTDGSGSFASLDGFLYWHDDTDDAGAGYRFRLAG